MKQIKVKGIKVNKKKRIIHLIERNYNVSPLSDGWLQFLCDTTKEVPNKYNSIDLDVARSEEWKLDEDCEYCTKCIKELATNDKY